MSTGKRGRFVVLAGPDGCGKDTQADLLCRALRAESLDGALAPLAVRMSEPTDGPLGAIIRQRLSSDWPIDPVEMAMLFAADRAAHVRDIDRWLGEGKHVVASRYIESSVVYQGSTLSLAGHRNAYAWVSELNSLFLRADLYVVIDVPAEISYQRVLRRAGSSGYSPPRPDQFERNVELRRRVYHAYRRLETLMPGETIVHVDGSDEETEVAGRIRALVEDVLGLGLKA